MTAPTITQEHVDAVRNAVLTASTTARKAARTYPGHDINAAAERQVELLTEAWGYLEATVTQ